jgi:hypothetical protein
MEQQEPDPVRKAVLAALANVLDDETRMRIADEIVRDQLKEAEALAGGKDLVLSDLLDRNRFYAIHNEDIEILKESSNIGPLLSVEYNRHKAIEKIAEFGPAFYPLVDALRGIIYGDVALLQNIAGRPAPPADRIYRILCDAMAAYVVAHEFGHVMLGHPLEGQQSFGQDTPAIVRQEHEADGFAFLMNILGQKRATMLDGHPESEQLSESSALTAFTAQDLLLRTYWTVEAICHNFCEVQTRKSRITSHPAYGDRLDLLKRTAIDVMPGLRQHIDRISSAHQDLVQMAADAFLIYAEQEGFGRDVAPYLRSALGL